MSSLGIFDKETKTYKKVADLSKPAVIDSAMSDTSTNAVQNKVVKSYVDNGVNSSKKLQTYKQGSTTETYGNDYNIYAQWDNYGHVKMKCDNYTVETDYATSAGSASSVAWNNVTGKPSTYPPSSQTGYYVGSNPPTNKNILWIDSLHGGMVKYFASDTSKWHPVRAKGYDTPVDLINEGYWHYFLGPGITVENISAIYDINTDKVTIIINNLNIISDASTGPTDMVSIAMPMYNLGHDGSFNPVQYNGPSNIDPYLYLDYPDGLIKTAPPYGIYKPATISSIKFETRLNYPAYTY